MSRLGNKGNEYQEVLGDDFDKIPKSVLAAIAVSFASSGGDYLSSARVAVMKEWDTLHKNGIVPQAPPKNKKGGA